MPQGLPKLQPMAVIAAIERQLAEAPAAGTVNPFPGSRAHPCIEPPVALGPRRPLGFVSEFDPGAVLDPKTGYYIDDFLKYHDNNFVINAYRGILRRHPDRVGMSAYLNDLRSGRRSKIEILGRLRYSPEGRGKRVQVAGLLLRFLVQSAYHLPVIGFCLRLMTAIPGLMPTIGNQHGGTAHVDYRLQRLSDETAVTSILLPTKDPIIREAAPEKQEN